MLSQKEVIAHVYRQYIEDLSNFLFWNEKKVCKHPIYVKRFFEDKDAIQR